MLGLLAAAKIIISGWDIGFFIACGVIIALIVAIYFLIPVFNKKQYQEQRDNLKKREIAFKANQGIAVEESEQQTDKSDVKPATGADEK